MSAATAATTVPRRSTAFTSSAPYFTASFGNGSRRGAPAPLLTYRPDRLESNVGLVAVVLHDSPYATRVRHSAGAVVSEQRGKVRPLTLARWPRRSSRRTTHAPGLEQRRYVSTRALWASRPRSIEL